MSYFFYIINHKTYDFLNTHVSVCQPSPAKSAKKMVAARSKTIHSTCANSPIKNNTVKYGSESFNDFNNVSFIIYFL